MVAAVDGEKPRGVEGTPPIALLVVADLLARSRLEEAASAEGIESRATRRLGPPPEADPPSMVVVDLELPGVLDDLPAWRERWPSLPMAGFVSHVDTERWASAERLSLLVVPRGATASRPREIFASLR